MRLIALADIHSNYAALEACLNYIDCRRPRADTGLIFLGDYVSDCPYPQRTMALLHEAATAYPCWFVRGNREEYQIEHHWRAGRAAGENSVPDWKYGSATGSLLYTYENLADADIEWFAKLPIASEVRLPGLPRISICHGSPSSTRERMDYGSVVADEYIRNCSNGLLLCGHLHEYFEYAPMHPVDNAAFPRATTTRSDIDTTLPVRRLIACPSTGVPVASDRYPFIPGAAGMLELKPIGNKWVASSVWVKYSIAGLLAEFDASGLAAMANCWARAMKKLLATGKDYTRLCLETAIRIAAVQAYPAMVGKNLSPAELPESCWQAAAVELGI